MTDLNNINLSNKNVTGSYKRDKKNDKTNASQQERIQSENIAKPADAYGRVLVSKVDNPEMVASVKESIEKFLNNPEIASAAVRASDDAYEFMLADNVPQAYEKACTGACDAALDRMD